MEVVADQSFRQRTGAINGVRPRGRSVVEARVLLGEVTTGKKESEEAKKLTRVNDGGDRATDSRVRRWAAMGGESATL